MLPTVFVPHGGGPLPLIGDPSHKSLTTFLRRFSTFIPQPKAILLISAHWESDKPRVTSSAAPSLIFDYYGFPPETYKFKYPAPGSPKLAAKIANLLRDAGMDCVEDEDRGWDHGVFVPLLLMYPEANIPVVQLSLISTMDPQEHYCMGSALKCLREEGVLMCGSGMSFHNMDVLRGGMVGATTMDNDSQAFDEALQSVCCSPDPPQRQAALLSWIQLPSARHCHLREEHLAPLWVVAGAAHGNQKPEEGQVLFSGNVLGVPVSGFKFG